jgi:AAA+ ATPase superfamily predicted ATPase
MEIPFNFGKIANRDLFINRDNEINKLKSSIESRINSILISPRRWGKSSLINQLAVDMQAARKRTRFCFIDLYAVRGEEEFYQLFAAEVLKATSTKWEDWIANGKTFIKQLIPRFQVGLDPFTDFSVSFDLKELKTKGGDEILDLPEKICREKNIDVVVCIDEFQNIAHFEDPLFMQKKMRSVWQKHTLSTYVLYGSKRHMLADIFENKSMPFYKFGDTLFLEKIDQEHWVPFIVRQFAKTKKRIDEGLATEIAMRMENHPYFVQLYSAYVWRLTKTRCRMQQLDDALRELFQQYALLYQREMDGLTNKQINFLRALAEKVQQFSSTETLVDYRLGSQGNIKRMKKALENKEIIDLWGEQVEFIDPLFKLWFKSVYLKTPPIR